MKIPCRSYSLLALALPALFAGCANHPPAPVDDRAPVVQTVAQDKSAATATVMPVDVPPGHYLVKKGDNLLRISLDHGQYYKDVAAWNNLDDPNKINVGQILRVTPPDGVVIKPVAPPPQVVSTVDTLKREPKGGSQPYSAEAYAKAKGDPAPVAPALVAKSADKPAEKASDKTTTEKSPEAKPADKAAPSTDGGPAWMWPHGGKLLAGFADSGNDGTNKGVDLSGRPGDAVLAAAGGKVVYAGSGLRGYGNLIIVKHDATYLSAYAHNSKILVKEGDSVSRGQKIGEVGSTDADQPKLHFEIRKLGKPVDPLAYLPKR